MCSKINIHAQKGSARRFYLKSHLLPVNESELSETLPRKKEINLQGFFQFSQINSYKAKYCDLKGTIRSRSVGIIKKAASSEGI